MPNKLWLAALLTLATTAGATPAPPATPVPPTPPPHPSRAPDDTCQAAGDVVFEIAHRLVPGVTDKSIPTPATTLYATGAWTFAAGGANGRKASGCLDAAAMKTIRADLAKAKWIVTASEVACDAMSVTFVEYSSHGKLVWAEELCSATKLDAASRDQLDAIVKILAGATAPKPPPCCKK